APATMLTRPVSGIRFLCACGAEYQAHPDHAGQPALCPRCNDVLFIPSAAASRAAGKPLAASRDRRDQYRPKTEGLSPLARFGIVLGVLLLLAASGYGAWALYFKDIAAQTGKGKPTALGLVPDDAVGFIYLRPNVGMKSKLFKEAKIPPSIVLDLLGRLRGQEDRDLLAKLDRTLGIFTGEVETLVLVDLGREGDVLVIETVRDLTPQGLAVLKTAFGQEPYLAHGRLFVVGTRATAKARFVKSLNEKKNEHGAFQQALALANPDTYGLAAFAAPVE